MRILGISTDLIITSACLVEDGKIIAACPEERLNRIKKSRAFPLKSINYCLQKANCSIKDIDYIAVGWNPGKHIFKLNPRFSAAARWRAEQLYSVPNYILSLINEEVDMISEEITTENIKTKILFVDHHLAHAGHFFFSPFEEAAILTCDGRGEEDTIIFAQGNKNKIEVIKKIKFPQSIGLLYGTFTQFLGFTPDCDEWKVMALSAFGRSEKENPYLEKLRNIVRLLPEGGFELDLSYFSYYLHDIKNFFTDKLINEFGKPRKADEEFERRHYQIAYALQVITEEALFYLIKWLQKITDNNNLVVSGGTFMNCVFNGKLLDKTKFKDMFVPSCPDDSGISIGAALYLYNHILDNKERYEQTHNYWGLEFFDEEIRQTLNKYNLRYAYYNNIEEIAAKYLAEGKIVGWFQGRMEFGQRALGNRSILADPRKLDMKSRINFAVKYREWFRPFAPSILSDYVQDYFIIGNNIKKVPFMEKVYKVKPEKQSEIPAVVHVDGTARLQTVDESNRKFYNLIENFKRITGVPIILNTSFNLNTEPIVCTPTDAIRTFFSCGLDVLVLGNCLLVKDIQDRGIKKTKKAVLTHATRYTSGERY